jgi:hypothetical protein
MPRIVRKPGAAPPVQAPEPVPKELCSVNKMIRLSPRVRDLLARLARIDGKNESAVVRDLIRREADRKGVRSHKAHHWRRAVGAH